MNMKTNIEKNVKLIQNDFIEYPNAQLLPVTKNRSIEEIHALYDLGYRIFGENRVVELLEKKEQLPEDIDWHLIGHLQTNKVKKIVKNAKLIHSVDSIRLIKEINKEASKLDYVQDILIQVNISKEESKSGFSVEELDNVMEVVNELRNIRILGLMTMAPLTKNSEVIKKVFSSLKNLFEKYNKISYNNISMNFLSMGMSSDYKIALEEGANLLRIGSKIFE